MQLDLAARLCRVGFAASVPELKIRNRFEERGDYIDDGDVHLLRRDKGAIARLELKNRPDLVFYHPSDYPYDTVFMGRASNYPKATHPYGALVRSGLTGSYIVAYPAKSFRFWRKETKGDNDESWLCPAKYFYAYSDLVARLREDNYTWGTF